MFWPYLSFDTKKRFLVVGGGWWWQVKSDFSVSLCPFFQRSKIRDQNRHRAWQYLTRLDILQGQALFIRETVDLRCILAVTQVKYIKSKYQHIIVLKLIILQIIKYFFYSLCMNKIGPLEMYCTQGFKIFCLINEFMFNCYPFVEPGLLLVPKITFSHYLL